MSRHWSDHPATLNALASQYVLGTLQGRARRRFDTLLAQRADVAERVADWEARLHRLAQALPPVAPRPALWDTLAQRAGLPADLALAAGTAASIPPPMGAPAQAAVVAPGPVALPAPAPVTAPVSAPVSGSVSGPVSPPVPARSPTQARREPAGAPGLAQRLSRFLQAFLAPVPAGALALGLLGGLVIPPVFEALNPPALGDTELPESYVGVLADADGRPGLIVASRRYGRVVDLKQVKPVDVPAGQTLFLWTLDAQGRATPVGPVPSGPFVQAPLADVAEKVFASAVELGVTLQAVGTRPDASQSAPTVWVFRGLCGKVWRVPPPAG